jgi:hypothetical protein
MESKIDSSEKDYIISQLKAQIFEYEQNEKNIHSIQSKHRNLQNEYFKYNLDIPWSLKKNSDLNMK